MEYRTEHDSMGEVKVDAERLWGAQTQRSLDNFRIGSQTMPKEIIHALAVLKSSAAQANKDLGLLDEKRAELIVSACEKIASGSLDGEFPLKVWQTGSGTQSNMNVNEVISNLAKKAGGPSVHPNDHANMSQSSNDVFPSAMHIAVLLKIRRDLLPACDRTEAVLAKLEEENRGVIKMGRTHLQDAVPLSFSQEISGWRQMVLSARAMIDEASQSLRKLAVGGTAVGTGLNCPDGFAELCCRYITGLTGEQFYPEDNKFHALSSKDACVYVHGALKALAANMLKMANDVRWLASGPRAGLAEISIPANEPGSSIMPGKINPTQCEAVTMAAVQVMGNDAAVGFAASQGNFELNVFMPLIAYDMLQSADLLADSMDSFTKNCLAGLKADAGKMSENVSRSLMLVTCLSPKIGYEKAAHAAQKAYADNTDLKSAVLELGYLTSEEYDEAIERSLKDLKV